MADDLQSDAPALQPPTKGRDATTGRFVVLNAEARSHGVRAYEETGRCPPELVERVKDDLEALVSDQGGASELSAARRLVVEQLGGALTVARLALNYISVEGVRTTRGRIRPIVPVYFNAIDRVSRLLAQLGLERRQRDLSTLTLTEYLELEKARQAAPATASATNDGGSDA